MQGTDVTLVQVSAKPKGKKKITKIVQANVIPKCNIKYRILNTNLKYAVNNCRSMLETQIRETNSMMKRKIREWSAREGTNVNFNTIFNDEETVRRENEQMRQVLSDLLNGSLSSLIHKSECKKLLKLIVPNLPNTKTTPYDVRKEVDFYKAYNSQTSLSSDILVEAAKSVKLY